MVIRGVQMNEAPTGTKGTGHRGGIAHVGCASVLRGLRRQHGKDLLNRMAVLKGKQKRFNNQRLKESKVNRGQRAW